MPEPDPGPEERPAPCGAGEDDAQPAGAGALAEEQLVAVAAYDYPDEAEALLAALDARRIRAYQLLDDGRDFRDQGGTPPCTRVLVPESQADAAQAVLAELEAAG